MLDQTFGLLACLPGPRRLEYVSREQLLRRRYAQRQASRCVPRENRIGYGTSHVVKPTHTSWVGPCCPGGWAIAVHEQCLVNGLVAPLSVYGYGSGIGRTHAKAHRCGHHRHSARGLSLSRDHCRCPRQCPCSEHFARRSAHLGRQRRLLLRRSVDQAGIGQTSWAAGLHCSDRCPSGVLIDLGVTLATSANSKSPVSRSPRWRQRKHLLLTPELNGPAAAGGGAGARTTARTPAQG